MPKNLYKSTNSFQNIILLLLFVIGMFVLYRYVKTIEGETKLLQNHMIELTEKINQIMNTTRVLDDSPIVQQHQESCNLNSSNVDASGKEEEEEGSVKSVDFTNMLKKVMMGGEDDDRDDIVINRIVTDVNNETEESTFKIEEIEENEEEEEITISSKTSKDTNKDAKEDLMRKTNEELKNMLKHKGLSTKGSKSELVSRLIM